MSLSTWLQRRKETRRAKAILRHKKTIKRKYGQGEDRQKAIAFFKEMGGQEGIAGLLERLRDCLTYRLNLVSAPAESDKKPVAWVNFTCSGKIDSHPQVQIHAKKLADGSTTGHARFRFLASNYEINRKFVANRTSSGIRSGPIPK